MWGGPTPWEKPPRRELLQIPWRKRHHCSLLPYLSDRSFLLITGRMPRWRELIKNTPSMLIHTPLLKLPLTFPYKGIKVSISQVQKCHCCSCETCPKKPLPRAPDNRCSDAYERKNCLGRSREKLLGRGGTQSMVIKRSALREVKLVALEAGTQLFVCLPGVRLLWMPLPCLAHHRRSKM